MAQRGVQMDEKKLCCSICLDLLQDPVTIPCGHSYCMSCIRSHWDQKNVYRCPQCRQIFMPRPVLVKSTMLADLVEELKKTGLRAAPADPCYAGPQDVGCDFCTGRKLKAMKSCLQCLVSYCEQHLQPHYESPAFEKHKLVDPSQKLQENICTRHNEVMKIFCRTDQHCICYLCSMDEHKGHDTVSAAAERTERQEELGASRQKIQQRIQSREKDVKVLQQEVEAINRSADQAVTDSEKSFADLIRLIEKRSSEVKQQIRSQQKTEVSPVKELQEKLQQEITDLRRRDAELEQLSLSDDHTRFLLKYPSLSNPTDSKASHRINIRPVQHFEDVTAAVSEARDKLRDVLSEQWEKISLAATKADVLPPQPQPHTRTDFLQCSRHITLDPNTANAQLLLSEGNRRATVMRVSPLVLLRIPNQLRSHRPDSHSDIDSLQVLSRERLTGRWYWEVEWSGFAVSVAVTYSYIRRAVYGSAFGNNDRSWAVYCLENGCEFRHNNVITAVSRPRSSRIGVYLDHSAGILCFYSVSETSEMTLLHRVQTTFTQPLYAGLWVCYGSTAELM